MQRVGGHDPFTHPGPLYEKRGKIKYYGHMFAEATEMHRKHMPSHFFLETLFPGNTM